MRKTALITGATGGIGSGFAKELSKRGYVLYLPVRSMQKIDPETGNDLVQELITLPNANVSLCNVEDNDQTDIYIHSLANDRLRINVIVLAAGLFLKDEKFSGASIEEKQENAVKALLTANFDTKKNVLQAIKKYFNDQLKDITLIVLSSHAAKDNFEWAAEQKGYVTAMKKVSSFAKEVESDYKKVILLEEGRVDTPGLRIGLNLEGNIPNMEKPEQFANKVLNEAGL